MKKKFCTIDPQEFHTFPTAEIISGQWICLLFRNFCGSYLLFILIIMRYKSLTFAIFCLDNGVHFNEYMAELYEEHKKQALEEFSTERLQSSYLANKSLAKPAINALSKARKLLSYDSTAGFIFSVIAMEVGLKKAILQPIVYGLVHSDSIASLIIKMAVERKGISAYEALLLKILEKHGGIYDITKYKRLNSKRSLWEEIKAVQSKRNNIMHQAESASKDEAALAHDVASEILEKLFPEIIANIGLHLHGGFQICNDCECECGNISIEEIQ